VLYHFRDTTKIAIPIASPRTGGPLYACRVFPTSCMFDVPVGMTPMEFHQDIWQQNIECRYGTSRERESSAAMRWWSRYDTFSCFDGTPVCDRRTDGRLDRRTQADISLA